MARKNIFGPVYRYVISNNGLQVPPGSTMKDAWAALEDTSKRIACARQKGEPIEAYLLRLRHALDQIPTPSINGAAVFALRQELSAWSRWLDHIRKSKQLERPPGPLPRLSTTEIDQVLTQLPKHRPPAQLPAPARSPRR